MRYTKGYIDRTSLEALARSVETELTRLAMVVNSESDGVILNTLYAAPDKTPEGLTVKADGTTWNPGSGAGTYQWRGGAWRFLG